MENKEHEIGPQSEVNSLTSQDVVNQGVKVGGEVVQQSIVWVLAGFLTKAIRDGITKVTGPKQ